MYTNMHICTICFCKIFFKKLDKKDFWFLLTLFHLYGSIYTYVLKGYHFERKIHLLYYHNHGVLQNLIMEFAGVSDMLISNCSSYFKTNYFFKVK